MSNKIIKTFVLFLILFCPLFVFAKSSKVKKFNKAKSFGYQNELLVIGALKNLYTAQANYFSTVGNRQFGNLAQLHEANLIDEYLAAGEKFGYIFSIQTDSNIPRFFVYAKPKVYSKTGRKSFYFDTKCEVRGANKNGADADINDPLIAGCTPTIAYDNETIAIQTIRQLASAQETYRSTVGNGNYGTFSALYQAGLISAEFQYGVYGNYYFTMETAPGLPANNTPAKFFIYAAPSLYGAMGFRSFYLDKSGVLKGADHRGGRADKSDPEITE